MKTLFVNRKVIVLILLTVSLIFGIQAASYSLFGGIIGGIVDVVGAVGDAVGAAVGAAAEGIGAAFAAAGEAVVAAAKAIGITIRAVGVIFWHTDSLNSIELFPNGGIIGVVISNLIHLWDVSSEQTTATLKHDAAIRSIAVSLDGGLLASASEDGNVQLWNPNTETLLNVLRGHTDKVLDVVFSPDGTLLASASEDNTVRLWDPNSATLQATLKDHTDNVLSLAFSPDGTLLVSASADGTVRVWNPHTHTLQETLTEHTNSVLAVTFNQDGTRFASASTDGTVQVWNTNTYTSQAYDHEAPVLSIAFSPNREILASGSSDGAVRLLDLGMKKVIAKLGHESPVRNVAYSPDGSMLYSTSEDGNMRKWEITPEDTQKVPDIQQSDETTTLAGFNVLPGDNDTSLVVHFSNKSLGLHGSYGFVFQWRKKDPQGIWHENCLNIKEGVISGKGAVIISNLNPNTTYEVRYRSQGLNCTFYTQGETSDEWSPITEGTTSGEPETEDTSTEDTTPEDTQKVPDIQQSEETSTLAGYHAVPGDNDTSLVVHFSNKSLGLHGSYGFVFQWREKDPQGIWHENCLNIKEGAISGKGAVIINNLIPNTTYEVRYRSQGLNCTFYTQGETSDKWSSITEGTTSGAPETKDTSTKQSETTSPTTEGIVSITPSSVASPAVGEQLELSLNITDGETVAGYQATVQFDTTALRYVSGANGDYLPAGAFFVKPVVEGNLVKLNAVSLEGESGGDGTLATLTFEVINVQESTLTLSDVLLTDSEGTGYVPNLENAQITKTQLFKGDVNGDGIVDIRDLVLVASNLGKTGQHAADVNTDGIVDIRDLVLVAGALGTSAAAPSLDPQLLSTLTAADVKQWLSQVQSQTLMDTTSLRGILFLQHLLAALTPKKTVLLANYPNPFNPETWIPYHLAKDAKVTLHIYAVNGTLVRTLTLGHQAAGMYQNRSRAAYWDGKNKLGEKVASGLYFYSLTAGDFTATRKMLIRK